MNGNFLPAIIALSCVLFTANGSGAADRSTWQEYMASGSMSQKALDFEAAQKSFERAEQEATKLGTGERVLAVLAQEELAEVQGNYGQADALLNKLKDVDSREVQQVQLNIRRKQSREIKPQDKAVLISAAQYWAAQKMLLKAQAQIKKEWVKYTPKVQYDQFTGIPANVSSAWSRTRFLIDPASAEVPAYVENSSASEKMDKAGLAALNVLKPGTFAAALPYPIRVTFTFSYNTAPNAALHDQFRKDYAYQKELLVWQEKHLGQNHAEVAESYSRAAKLLADAGSQDAATQAFNKAIEVWKANAIVCDGTIGTYQQYGDALLASKKFSEALPVLRRAHELAQQAYLPDTKMTVDTMVSLSRALAKTGNKTESSQLAAKARELAGPEAMVSSR